MAKHYLLLGAGFSRNWGGWLASEVFEYLLGCRQVEERPAIRELLWRFKHNGGFEAALAELQRGDGRVRPELDALQAAIAEMFDVMNAGFFKLRRFEFSNEIGSLVRELLVRFDAIFTLNQDLLLERRYMDGNVALTEPRKWNGAALPGVRLSTPPPNDIDPATWRNARWQVEAGPYSAPKGVQPIYKLHGSSQWIDPDGSGMLIMGGGKFAAIKAQPLLNSYQSQFEAALNEGDARLMAIGYSFSDGHIDQIIRAAAQKSGLKIFIVDPRGVDVLDRTLPGQVRAPDPLQVSMIGASRRSLQDIFGGDGIEHAKLLRFFA